MDVLDARITSLNTYESMKYITWAVTGSCWRCFRESHVFYDDPESSEAPMTRAV